MRLTIAALPLLISASALAAGLESVSTTIDADSLVHFSMQFDSLPDFNIDQTTGKVPDSFRLTLYANGAPASVIRGDEMWYGYGLPIHNPNDPDPLIPGQWRGAIRYTLNGNTLTYFAHLDLLNVPQTFTYTVERYSSGLLAQAYGCQSSATCVPSLVATPAPTPQPVTKPYQQCRVPGVAIVVTKK